MIGMLRRRRKNSLGAAVGWLSLSPVLCCCLFSSHSVLAASSSADPLFVKALMQDAYTGENMVEKVRGFPFLDALVAASSPLLTTESNAAVRVTLSEMLEATRCLLKGDDTVNEAYD